MDTEHKFTDDAHIKHFLNFNKNFVTHIAKLVGHLTPFASLFSVDENGTGHNMFFDRIGDFLGTEASKDLLDQVIIPTGIKKVIKKGFRPLCLVYCTEGWSWLINANGKTEEEIKEIERNRFKYPKKEVILLTFETMEKVEMYQWEIERNKDEKIINLKEMEGSCNYSGRFTHMLRNTVKNEK